MDNLPRKKKPTISISLPTTFSNSFSSDRSPNLTKSPRNFQGDMVGLRIVAAMNDLGNSHEALSPPNSLISPMSSPLPVVSSAKPAANFRTSLDLERNKLVDDLSESYTCVISHFGNHSTRKRVYFGDKLNGIKDSNACLLQSERSSDLPVNDREVEMEILTTDFLTCCFLCKKKLHGLDIFMYRGEKAFCSVECRDKLINGEDCKEQCRSEASPCSSASTGFQSGVAAA